MVDDRPLLLFLVDCSSNRAAPYPSLPFFFVYAGATYWRANSSNEITACKRLFTRRVLKEIVKNYIILPLAPPICRPSFLPPLLFRCRHDARKIKDVDLRFPRESDGDSYARVTLQTAIDLQLKIIYRGRNKELRNLAFAPENRIFLSRIFITVVYTAACYKSYFRPGKISQSEIFAPATS